MHCMRGGEDTEVCVRVTRERAAGAVLSTLRSRGERARRPRGAPAVPLAGPGAGGGAAADSSRRVASVAHLVEREIDT